MIHLINAGSCLMTSVAGG